MIRRILVATDGSTTATAAVDRAVDVARTTGASLTVLSAGDDGVAAGVVAAEAARLAAAGVEVDTVAVPGDPAAAIVGTARDAGYDLVVIGNKGMTGPRRHFTLGSVPNKVSHSLTCSLLIVRTT